MLTELAGDDDPKVVRLREQLEMRNRKGILKKLLSSLQ
jgi:hypothetical protein